MSASSELEPKFRLAICGAGIGGLVLAITIGKYDPSIPIDLYEAHDSIETAGAAITVWRQAREVMLELGLFDEFKQIFMHNPDSSHGARVRRSDIREGGYSWYHRVHRRNDGPSGTHRQHMVAILERNLPVSCTVHSKKRLVDYTEQEQQNAHSTSPITLNFADGTSATTDVLVGADGIRSVVRKKMFETASEDNGDDKTDLKQYIEATFTGTTVYRCLIPADRLKKETPENLSLQEMIAYSGKGRFLVTYPIVKGTLINVVAMVIDPSLMGTHYEGHWVSDASRDELVEYFDNFESDARTVLKLCEKPSKWALHVVKPLPFCVRKRVALIGDACHAMTPNLAAGAGQAVEDAFVLGRLIAHPLTTLYRIQEVLRIYEGIRLPFVRSAASLSLSMGWMQSFMAPGYYDGTRREDNLDDKGIGVYEREGMETLRQEIEKHWDFMDESGGALPAWQDAKSKLQALAGQVVNQDNQTVVPGPSLMSAL